METFVIIDINNNISKKLNFFKVMFIKITYPKNVVLLFIYTPFCLHNSAKQLRTIILKLFYFNQLFKIFDPAPYESYNGMRMKKIDFSCYFFRLVQRSAIDLVTTYGCRLAVHM